MSPPVTLITGATQGIGRATANKLASAGHLVIGIARHTPAQSFPGKFYAADLSDERATAAVLEEITATYDIDHLVNNAGEARPQTLPETTLADFQAVISLNLRAALQCTQACLPAMQRKRRGRIVNISSRAAFGKEKRTAYSAAKSGLLGFTRTWALELGEYGITVNAVAPGPIMTELYQRNNPMDPDSMLKVTSRIPLRRLGTPEDVAGAIAFLLSEDAAFMTGQVLNVCGGMTVGHVGS